MITGEAHLPRASGAVCGRGNIASQNQSIWFRSMILAVAGGVAGLFIAAVGLRVLLALAPTEIPRLDQIRIDWQVLAFALGVSLITGVIFGLVPALQASKPDLNESLKEGGRGSTGSVHRRRIRSALVVAEIALSLVLLIGAGLMMKSFLRADASITIATACVTLVLQRVNNYLT